MFPDPRRSNRPVCRNTYHCAEVSALRQRVGENSYSWYRMEPIRAIREYGIINSWIFQCYHMGGCTPEEIEFATRYVEEAEQRHPCTRLVEPHRRNLILILTESLCAWPVGLEVGGTEVTPYLNSLARDTTVLYFPKVLPQVKDGRSSDAQLILNTGLLPLASGAASGTYGLNTYPSLPKALKNWDIRRSR